MRLFSSAVLALAVVISGCTPADQEKAQRQAEKAKVQVKQGLRQADQKLSEGGEKLKREVKKATNKALHNSGERDSGTRQ